MKFFCLITRGIFFWVKIFLASDLSPDSRLGAGTTSERRNDKKTESIMTEFYFVSVARLSECFDELLKASSTEWYFSVEITEPCCCW